jgi:hypothetical protein
MTKPLGGTVKVKDYHLTNAQYVKLLEYSWRTHAPVGSQITDSEIEAVTGARKRK